MIKRNKDTRILFVLGCMVLLQACPMIDRDMFPLYLENNSNDTLGVYVANGFYSAYPDTLLPDKYQDGLLSGIPNGNMTGAVYSFKSPEKEIKQLPNNILSIFILSMNNNYGIETDSIWKEMNYGTRFLRRYDMSIQDLKELNYSIPYPPDERMKTMKMYPPYDE